MSLDNSTKKNINDYDKIIICHYGKVASNTLEQSLVSVLNCDSIKIKSNVEYSEKILVTYDNYSVIKNLIINDKKILILSICRNLIDRIVSMHFQINGDDIIDKLESGEIIESDIINLFNKINKKALISLDNYYQKLIDNINLYINPYEEFNKNNYIFKKSRDADFLLIKYEDIKIWGNIFFEIFGLENFTLINKNLSMNKSYYELYQKTLSNAKNEYNNNLLKKTKHYKFFYKTDCDK